MGSKAVENKFLPRRFDLIKQMYCSDRVIAANKKDLMFNWFFEQFKKYQHKNCSYMYQLLWKTFYEILMIEKEKNAGYRILIKTNSTANLLNAITNYPHKENPQGYVILQSVTTFLQTPAVNATLIADAYLLLKILVASINIINKTHGSGKDNDILSVKEATILGNTILDILENLPTSNDTRKISIFTQFLEDVAFFIHIAETDEELSNLSDKLIKKMVNIIFNLKTKDYEDLLKLANSKMDNDQLNENLAKFFTSLQNLWMSEKTPDQSLSMCALLMKKLLSAALVQHKHDFHSFKISALFFAVAGLNVSILSTENSCLNSLFEVNLQNNINIMGINYLLQACSIASQCFISMSVPAEYKRPSSWLKDVSSTLLETKYNMEHQSVWLKCLQSLFTIAPSILESGILSLIKIVFLDISVHSTESKTEYCKLFDIILQAHLQLHQVPKFFVKLLLALTECIKTNSCGSFLANGKVLPEIQQSIAKCIKELPHGQMIELWRVFIETFSALEMMIQTLQVSKSYLFFVVQLFSTFLLHTQLFQANVPFNVYSRISKLIENTSDEIKKNISALKDTDPKVAPFQWSLLHLSYVLGEVKLAYSVYYEQLPGMTMSCIPEKPFDFSLVHSFLSEDFACVLESFLGKEDKILSVLVFQLLLQKVKALQFKEGSIEKKPVKKLIAIIIEQLELSSSAMDDWDSDISTISANNYGTVLWKMFLKISPLILSSLHYKNLHAISHTLVQKIFLDARCGSETKCALLSLLRCEFFQESKPFRAAFISALWVPKNRQKKRSHDEMSDEDVADITKLISVKSLKQSSDSSENSETLLNRIAELCDISNSSLLAESSPKKKLKPDEINDIVKVDSGDSYEWTVEFIQQLVSPGTRNTESPSASKQSGPVDLSKPSLEQNDKLELSDEDPQTLSKLTLLQKLHHCQLCSESYEKFIETYNTLFEVLYKIVLQIKSFGLASPTILAYIGKLLKFLVKGIARYSHLSGNREMKLCAFNMNRLLIALVRHRVEFSKLVPYLVADYVDTVQHVMLEADIKEIIMVGIYRLLDICSEESIKMLTVNINHVSREIYVNLIKSYRQHQESKR